ncbi:MAG TPA: hypothetical protein VJO34_00830 [Methylomirabilota bacterium]|nr:hypothetical protein [Methylomirabilota bacterium]
MKSPEEFVAAFVQDDGLRERIARVFRQLPESVQREFMDDPAFGINIAERGRWTTRVFLKPPEGRNGSRLIVLDSSLRHRSLAFAHYVIAHEFAHAALRNRGRHPGEDPEHAADSLALAWGFPRPAPLPILS